MPMSFDLLILLRNYHKVVIRRQAKVPTESYVQKSGTTNEKLKISEMFSINRMLEKARVYL